MRQNIRLHSLLASALMALSVLGVACSDSDDDSSGSSSSGATSECNRLVSKICDGLSSCDETLTHSSCVAQVNQTFEDSFGEDCSGADQVGSTYDQCMSDLNSVACGGDLPDSCSGVILYEETRSGTPEG